MRTQPVGLHGYHSLRHLGAFITGKPWTRTELGPLKDGSQKDFWVVISHWPGGYADSLEPTQAPQAWRIPTAHTHTPPGSRQMSGEAVSQEWVTGVHDNCLFPAQIYINMYKLIEDRAGGI